MAVERHLDIPDILLGDAEVIGEQPVHQPGEEGAGGAGKGGRSRSPPTSIRPGREAMGRDCPILIDQEGGRVQRLEPPGWRKWLPPLDQAAGRSLGPLLVGANQKPVPAYAEVLEAYRQETLREMMEEQLLGVLGTHRDGEPYTSLVGFAATDDLKQLLFATGRATRKHANLVDDARASMLIDTRTNRPADFTEAAAADPASTGIQPGAYQLQQQDEKSVALLESALRRDPFNPAIHYELGTARIRLQQWEEARAALEKELAELERAFGRAPVQLGDEAVASGGHHRQRCLEGLGGPVRRGHEPLEAQAGEPTGQRHALGELLRSVVDAR